ncbi:MAG: cellulose 1,4-beta-cellobiosidase [Clostridium sp.]|jgi:hypothetical protein|nr:cellulose 1,4-beta-cellobiosidase [Clostridium sp.]
MKLIYNVKRRRKIFIFGLCSLAAVAIITSAMFIMKNEGNSNPSGSISVPNNTKPSTEVSTVYSDRFIKLFEDIYTKGYLSEEGIPYHAIETLVVDATDYGHLTTSAAFSYMVWLGATYGKLTGDWSYFMDAWDKTEQYIIPEPQRDQPGADTYLPGKPAQYAPEANSISGYPVAGSESAPTGIDPIAEQMASVYGSKAVYQMHWLLDVDNWYGYGNHGDGKSRCSYINTYRRGPEESVWETIPHPSWEDFKWDQVNNSGFLSLFGSFIQPTKQWHYTSASDADARQIQATYWAYLWSKEQGKNKELKPYFEKAAKMGDYLRYSLFDKYFRPIGVQNGSSAGKGYDSCHYLLSWNVSWGGDIGETWSWRIGNSHCHQGYQNPVAAFALSNEAALKPKSKNAKKDWEKSLERQLELFQYLQSSEGAIAGGVTNSWNGKYEKYPEGTSTFYELAYDWQPVYHDPPSNSWFGFQAWSMERIMEYYYLTGDKKISELCRKWASWAMDNTYLNSDGTYEIPSTLEWSGQPDTWNGKPSSNKNLHCTIKDWTVDVGVTASYAKALIYYAIATEKHEKALNEKARETAKQLLDRMWKNYKDDLGITAPESRDDYKRFFDEVYIPGDFSGTNAQGAEIKNGITFIEMRPKYRNASDFSVLEETVNSGNTPVMKYHRYWVQAEIAMANAMYHIYFEQKKKGTIPGIELEENKGTTSTSNPDNTPVTTLEPTPTITSTQVPEPTNTSTITPTNTNNATNTPTIKPTPTRKATNTPTNTPTKRPTYTSTKRPTNTPTKRPTNTPTKRPTNTPTKRPTNTPTKRPTNTPTKRPTNTPTKRPTNTPTKRPTSTPTKKPVNPPNNILLQYYNNNANEMSSNINVSLKLTNNSDSSIKLSDVKIRYYYTIDGEKPQNFACDWSTIGGSNVTGRFVKLPSSKSNADYYLEIGFTDGAGSLEPNNSIDIQARLWKSDWSNYILNNDYSTSSGRIALYISGRLVSGSEP